VAPKREYRNIPRSPEQLAELRAARERYQREKPTMKDLAAKGGVFVPMGALMALHQLAVDLRREREKQALTLGQLAERTGIDEPALSRIETGKNPNPTVATLARIAGALGKVITFRLEDKPPAPVTEDDRARKDGRPAGAADASLPTEQRG
jgi:transcriptional regulator with XRE-family HTH domain